MKRQHARWRPDRDADMRHPWPEDDEFGARVAWHEQASRSDLATDVAGHAQILNVAHILGHACLLQALSQYGRAAARWVITPTTARHQKSTRGGRLGDAGQR